MTVTDEKLNQPAPLACPNCGAVGTLRVVVTRSDATKRIDTEYRCSSCNVVIVHSDGKDGL